MTSWRLALRTLPCLAALLAACPASAAPRKAKAPGQEYIHRVIVKLRDKAESGFKVLSAERVSKLSASSREKLSFVRAMSGKAHVMTLPRKMTVDDAKAVATRLMEDPDVEYAEPDLRRYPALVPTEADYANLQWHYHTPAAPDLEKAGVNLPAAWGITTGASSVVVAVIDTGTRTHVDLDQTRFVQGYDFVSADGINQFYTANDGNGRDSDPGDPGDWITALEDAGTDPLSGDFFQGCGQDDSSWHGTHVTGTIGATPNNGFYGVGVDWNAKILPVRVLGKCGGYDSDIADAIRWAAGLTVSGVPANANPAKVINMSIQGSGICPAVYQSAIDEAVAAGAVIVAAAGNAGGAAGSSPPGNCNGVITVGAVNRAGNRASYSNYGPEVDISAPGGEGADGVYSISNTGTTVPAADTALEKNGTSMAAPHVSGVVALMRAFNPSLTPATVLADLQACSRPFVGGSTCDTSNCGAGMVDARGALRPGVVTGLAVSEATSTKITWTWTAVSNASYNVYVASDPSKFLGNTGLGVTSFSRTDLTPDVYTGIVVKASNTVCAGGPSVSPSTSTTADASVVTAADPWVSSVTVTFAQVFATNSGYRVDASTASNFTGTIFSSGSAVFPASAKLTVPGLTSFTSYYLRVAVLNQIGNETRTVYGSQVYTLTSLSAPGPGSFSDFGTRQVRLSWTAGANPSALLYTVQASTASNFTGTVSSAAGTDLFQNLFTGLQVNTSYYFRVWPAGGPAWSTGPVATYALSPSTATPLFSNVADQALTVSWTSGGNPSGTRYEAQVSRGADFFSQVVSSSFTANSSATFTGLVPNSVYYARVRAVSHGGQPAPATYRSLSSTGTLASLVAPVAPFFQAVSSASLAALFDSGANTAGTGYVARLSTASDFSVISAQVSGVMIAGTNAAPFSGLTSNCTYFLQVAALNVTGTPTAFSEAVLAADRSTSTFPAPPAYSSASVYFTSITFVWTSGGNQAGTTYYLLVDDDPAFASPAQGFGTSLSSAVVSLSSNTAYYARVRALALGSGNPDSSLVDLTPRYTLPDPPTAPGGAFLSVTFTSVTVGWQALPLGPPSATCSGYRIQLSSAQGFTGTVHSADVSGAGSTRGAVAGLSHSTTYYLRIGSLNADGAAAYALMGSTRTLVPQISSSPVNQGSTELNVAPPYPEVRFIRVSITEKTFAVGTAVELNTSVAAELPPLAGQPEFAFIGVGAGFSLSAGGMQPSKPVPITIGYELPVGADDRLLMLGRYDDTSHKWLALPSSVDRGAKTLTGLVDHFSFFAPLIVQPGTDVSSVEIYPIPWEPESGSSLYGGGVLTLSRLPAQARVRIYTHTGDMVDEGTASFSGVLHWDGRNTRGHRVGTGTYLVVIESDGRKTVRSVAVIR